MAMFSLLQESHHNHGSHGGASLMMALLIFGLSCVVTSSDLRDAKSNKVEFKTQAPPMLSPEAPKYCYEYLYGRLSAIRLHGSTWQNGVSDCSNCTCDNGDIRCFFHFCNGPSTGYMTPPSTLDDPLWDIQTEKSLTKKEEDEEYSGYPPEGVTDDEDEAAEWPPKIFPEKWQNELSTFETSSAPSTSLRPDLGFFLMKDKEKKDRTENETHDVLKTYFCGKTCKKSCLKGFKVDPVTGCWKCRCNICPSHLSCTNKCVFGYAVDINGCETCTCLSLSDTINEDITFNENHEDKSPPPSNDNSILDVGKSIEEESSERSQSKTSSGYLGLTEITLDEDKEVRGCLDGTRRLAVGGSWSRGPCVACRCVAPGYSECNITQCHALNSCSRTRRFTPAGACCPICKDSMPSYIEKAYESRSTSRVPTDYFAAQSAEDKLLRDDPAQELDAENETTVRSIVKDEQFNLLFILLPMGVVFTLGVLLSTHLWRRYYRDKYDINAYRPEEKQKLRPVKTLHDDQTCLRHV